MDALLEAKNLEASYGPVIALRGVSLTVLESEIVTILGANGAGKTTLLKVLCGALDPTRGAVRLSGRDIRGLAPNDLVRLGVAHVPQNREVFPLLSVHKNLLMGAYSRRDRERIDADLDTIYAWFPPLRSRQGSPAILLSGGEQQMLAIGRALMSRPRVLLLDEPSLGLAPSVAKDIFVILERIRKQGVAILVVEQNAKQALALADRGYVLELGRVVMEGRGAELIASDDIREAYFGIRSDGGRAERRWRRKKRWR